MARPISVVVKFWAKEGSETEMAEAFKYMIDIVIQEQTCRLLKAHRSASDPLHYILYEEWDDYDEFMNVQLQREYRSEFTQIMDRLRAAPIEVEIFDLVYQPQ